MSHNSSFAKLVMWQRIVSPHQAGLVRTLAALGVDVTYVALQPLSPERAALGWSTPDLGEATVRIIASERDALDFAYATGPDVVHITQGLRRNGYVQAAISALRSRGARWGAFMERIDNRGLRGLLRRIDYGRILSEPTMRPDFILAAGKGMSSWLVGRGYPASQVFPFAYFLQPLGRVLTIPRLDSSFRVGFVGRLIPLKRVELLLEAVAGMVGRDISLHIIGDGPEAPRLRSLAHALLPSRKVNWVGSLPRVRVLEMIADLDCIVLPSEHDGWGAVVSEALMSGVPAICSDACGGAIAVEASGVGGVFRTGDCADLRRLLERECTRHYASRVSREDVARWADCISANAGAPYLLHLLDHLYRGLARPGAPWEVRTGNP